jgi:hypothetical protein
VVGTGVDLVTSRFSERVSTILCRLASPAKIREIPFQWHKNSVALVAVGPRNSALLRARVGTLLARNLINPKALVHRCSDTRGVPVGPEFERSRRHFGASHRCRDSDQCRAGLLCQSAVPDDDVPRPASSKSVSMSPSLIVFGTKFSAMHSLITYMLRSVTVLPHECPVIFNPRTRFPQIQLEGYAG